MRAHDARPFALLATVSHLLLLMSIAVVGYRAAAPPWRELAAGVGVAPLLATLPGLLTRRRRALVWLALLLVVYAGAAVTEAVASAGAQWAASVAALAAVIELAVLPILSRRDRSRPQAARE
jgi:uncharacterized membrane protein